LAVRLLPADRLEGAVNKGPYGAQCQAWRCPVPVHPNSAGGLVAVPKMALQWRG
jgi:hypothetical protein